MVGVTSTNTQADMHIAAKPDMPFSLRGAARGSQGPMEQEGPEATAAAGEPAGSWPAQGQPARGATSRVGQESPGPGTAQAALEGVFPARAQAPWRGRKGLEKKLLFLQGKLGPARQPH